MEASPIRRVGAACGAVFAIVLVVANGDGSQSFNAGRAVVGSLALVLAIPFIGYLCGVLRQAEGPDGWLAGTAIVAGTGGIVIKMVSGVPELAIHQAHLTKGTQLRHAFSSIADGATVLSLYPLAVFAAATAVVALRTKVLPQWLAVGTAITAIALAVNAGFLTSTFVPAFLVFALWSLLTSIWLMRALRPIQADGRVPHRRAASSSQV